MLGGGFCWCFQCSSAKKTGFCFNINEKLPNLHQCANQDEAVLLNSHYSEFHTTLLHPNRNNKITSNNALRRHCLQKHLERCRFPTAALNVLPGRETGRPPRKGAGFECMKCLQRLFYNTVAHNAMQCKGLQCEASNV